MTARENQKGMLENALVQTPVLEECATLVCKKVFEPWRFRMYAARARPFSHEWPTAVRPGGPGDVWGGANLRCRSCLREEFLFWFVRAGSGSSTTLIRIRGPIASMPFGT